MIYPGSYDYNMAEGAGHCHHGYPDGNCRACDREAQYILQYRVGNGAVYLCRNCDSTFCVTDGDEPDCCQDATDDGWLDDYDTFNPIDQGLYDDDPSPYDGTYSED